MASLVIRALQEILALVAKASREPSGDASNSGAAAAAAAGGQSAASAAAAEPMATELSAADADTEIADVTDVEVEEEDIGEEEEEDPGPMPAGHAASAAAAAKNSANNPAKEPASEYSSSRPSAAVLQTARSRLFNPVSSAETFFRPFSVTPASVSLLVRESPFCNSVEGLSRRFSDLFDYVGGSARLYSLLRPLRAAVRRVCVAAVETSHSSSQF